MYSSQVSSYETHVRNAFEPLLLQYSVDAYFAGHIHWYERIWPMNNMSIVTSDIVDDHSTDLRQNSSASLAEDANARSLHHGHREVSDDHC